MTDYPAQATVTQCGNDDHDASMLAQPLRDWIHDQLGGAARALTVRSLHGGASPWWIEWTTNDGSIRSAVLRTPSSRISPGQVVTNAAALTVTGEHHLPAPRLIAVDLDGHFAGTPASLETALTGCSTWPVRPPAELFTGAGERLAQLHAVGFVDGPALPVRPRPIAEDDFARDRREGRMPSTALLDKADERVRAAGAPAGPRVFVHGDVWPGNTLINGGDVHALIDWKGAGVGHPGVDVGELGKQVTLLFDGEAADLVLRAWQRMSGARLDIAYWDAVAALNTPTECWSVSSAARRDEVLSAAIAQL